MRALYVLLVAALGALLLAAPAAAEAETIRVTPEFEEGQFLLYGQLLQGARGEETGVPGVVITVTGPDGTEFEPLTTDDVGYWQLEVDSPGVYSVALDESTLPEGVSLRNPDNNPLERPANDQRATIALFPLAGEGAVGGGSNFGDSLRTFVQLVVSGISFGLIIAMTAIGLSLIFGTTGLTNFAHGELVTFGAIVAWYLNNPNAGLGLHLLIAGPLAVVVGGAFGGALDLGLFRPLRRRSTGLIALMVVTIGLSLLFRHAFQFVFGGGRSPYTQYTLQQPYVVLGVRLAPKDLASILLGVAVLVAVAFLLQRTRVGKAMRAVADNRDLAESSGINVQRVILFVWILGGALAALGGVLQAVSEQVFYLGGFQLLLLMFAGITLGGLGTAYGALVGGIVIGILTQLSTLVLPADLKNMTALLVLIIILLVRPQGILGRAERVG